MIDVVVPVGPHEHNVRWLAQCLQSIESQTTNEELKVWIVDDGPHVEDRRKLIFETAYGIFGVRRSFEVWCNPWNLGVAASSNIGAGLGEGEFIQFVASDDWLEPTCIAEGLMQARRTPASGLGHYYYALNYWSEGRVIEVNRTACMNGLTSRALWWEIGGLPPESGVGAADKFLMSVMYTHYKDKMIPVRNDIGLYNHRLHPDQYYLTRKAHLEGVIQSALDHYMANWQPRAPAPRVGV